MRGGKRGERKDVDEINGYDRSHGPFTPGFGRGVEIRVGRHSRSVYCREKRVKFDGRLDRGEGSTYGQIDKGSGVHHGSARVVEEEKGG